MTRRLKGIGLISGGLDSILAVKVLQEQDLDLVGVVVITPFFRHPRISDLSSTLNIPVRVIDIGARYLEMLRDPRYGYGRNMNPCIDCHGLMLREAGRLMDREGADFLFTGEVLGQRPMSQRRDALRSVENLSGYPGRVLRPLSARLLPPTLPESRGEINRDKLLDLQGRSRKRQMALAEFYGIREYAQPGGGCMLTKEGFARRLRLLLESRPHTTLREVEFLKYGRCFQLPRGEILIVGRQKIDNEHLEALASENEAVLRAKDYPSPVGLLLAPVDPLDLSSPGALVGSYSDAPAGKPVRVEWRLGSRMGILMVEKDEGNALRKFLV